MPRLPFNFSSLRNGSLRSVEDAAALGWPVLGSIAEFESQAGARLAGWDRNDVLEADKPLAEAVRLPNLHVRGRAIIVASAPGGAGGTTTARNLASLRIDGTGEGDVGTASRFGARVGDGSGRAEAALALIRALRHPVAEGEATEE